ncbi:MAG: hypothetical protein U0768_08835 [Anaerolineae bacterium]
MRPRPQPPFRAGLALAAYGRQMARRTAWTACLIRGSRWLAPLLAPHHPLRAGPLLGPTLAALAADADGPPEERAAPPRRQAQVTPTRPDGTPRGRPAPMDTGAETPAASGTPGRNAARAAAPHHPPDAPTPSRLAARVAELPRQASPALLAGFAGAASRAVSRAPRTDAPGAALGPGSRLQADGVGGVSPRPSGVVWPAADGPAGRDWAATPIERVIGAVQAAGGGRDAGQLPVSAASFEAALSTRLDGPTAPLFVLTRSIQLASDASAGDAAPNRAEAAAAPPVSDAPRPAPLPSPPPARPATNPPLRTDGGAPFAPSLWGMLDYPVAASAFAPPGPDPETTVRVVNPTLAPRLPFLTPSEPGGPPDLPLAAATARQGAWAEAAGEDDLEALAAKLKRILNEEARRHGIGV